MLPKVEIFHRQELYFDAIRMNLAAKVVIAVSDGMTTVLPNQRMMSILFERCDQIPQMKGHVSFIFPKGNSLLLCCPPENNGFKSMHTLSNCSTLATTDQNLTE